MDRKILCIVGSYRKGGTIDLLVTEALSSASALGAETTKIYLIDQHIEFCRCYGRIIYVLFVKIIYAQRRGLELVERSLFLI